MNLNLNYECVKINKFLLFDWFKFRYNFFKETDVNKNKKATITQ